MASERRSFRGVALVEDKLQERFLRNLLPELGYNKRNWRFEVAPRGRGSAEDWVRMRYPAEVKALRSKSFQASLGLIAMRDGDNLGVDRRKHELNETLRADQQEPRGPEERIAAPVPTWSIETWLLHLLGEAVNETKSLKREFPPAGWKERSALRKAAQVWTNPPAISLPSLEHGREEFARLRF